MGLKGGEKVFRVEDLSESVREKFVGVVVKAEFPCNCEICEKGTQRLIEMGREPRETERVHIVIKPIEKYENFQHAWYNRSKLIWSGIGAFTVALNKLLGFTPQGKTPEEQWNEVRNFLMCKAFVWDSVNPVDFIVKTLGKIPPKNLPEGLKGARETWVPVKIVSERELEFMGIMDLKEFCEKARREYEEAEVTESDVDQLVKEHFSGESEVRKILEV